MTHPSGRRCPLASDPLIEGYVTSCCTFPGYMAVRELRAHGMRALAARMLHGEELSAADAVAFSRELEDATRKLVAKHADLATQPQGARWEPAWSPELKEWDCDFRPDFEESVAVLRAAARWYAYVGRRGFGVEAVW